MRRGKVLLQAAALGVVALLLGLLAWQVAQRQKGNDLSGQIAKGSEPAAPGLVLERLDGPGKVSLASLRGKAVVVNFWASWCVPCKSEAPRLQAAWQRFRGRNVVFLGVDAQDFSSDARTFVDKYRLTYPIVHDGPGSTLGHWGVSGFPETFFVGRDGRLVAKVVGPVDDRQLDTNIALALRSRPAAT